MVCDEMSRDITSLERLWGFKGHCSLAWLAAWLHKVLLLSE